MADDVQLTDLEIIQRYSLAVRGATAPRAELVASLQADLDWLRGPGRAAPRAAPVKPAKRPARIPAEAPTSPATSPGRRPARTRTKAPAVAGSTPATRS